VIGKNREREIRERLEGVEKKIWGGRDKDLSVFECSQAVSDCPSGRAIFKGG
jgi:hypothetical protein